VCRTSRPLTEGPGPTSYPGSLPAPRVACRCSPVGFDRQQPDIMLSVGMCARFQANPMECLLIVVKRILRYLVHTPNLGLWYPNGSTFDLLRYFDSDYASCKVDRKSMMGTCQFHGRFLVSWSSKKQNSVALSTAEAEYVAAGAC
jgi:hypothetical protein